MSRRDKPPTFHAFTIQFDRRVARITTQVELCKAFDPHHPPDPPFPHLETSALWDTGATRSVVTRSTAQAIGLDPTGATTIHHAGGTSQVSTYLVNFILPNHVGVSFVQVSECPDDAGAFGAIVGMDIISQGDLCITNPDNRTVMSFRFPSIEAIDYVVEARRIKFAGVNRNDPCPCGKKDEEGKPIKFKHCHGALPQVVGRKK